jgi:hypothetical protein
MISLNSWWWVINPDTVLYNVALKHNRQLYCCMHFRLNTPHRIIVVAEPYQNSFFAFNLLLPTNRISVFIAIDFITTFVYFFIFFVSRSATKVLWCVISSRMALWFRKDNFLNFYFKRIILFATEKRHILYHSCTPSYRNLFLLHINSLLNNHLIFMIRIRYLDRHFSVVKLKHDSFSWYYCLIIRELMLCFTELKILTNFHPLLHLFSINSKRHN